MNTMKDLMGIPVSNCVIYSSLLCQCHPGPLNWFQLLLCYMVFHIFPLLFCIFLYLEHTVGDQLNARNVPDKTYNGQANDAIIEHQSTDGITPNNEHHYGGPSGCISNCVMCGLMGD